MKSLLLTASLLIAAFSGQAYAHGDHGAVSDRGAKSIAARAVQKMTVRDFGYKACQLDESWKVISQDKVTVKESGAGFYVIEVGNAASDEKVYVKVLESGVIEDAAKNYPF